MHWYILASFWVLQILCYRVWISLVFFGKDILMLKWSLDYYSTSSLWLGLWILTVWLLCVPRCIFISLSFMRFFISCIHQKNVTFLVILPSNILSVPISVFSALNFTMHMYTCFTVLPSSLKIHFTSFYIFFFCIFSLHSFKGPLSKFINNFTLWLNSNI